MQRFLAMAAMAWAAVGASAASGDVKTMEPEWTANGAAPAREENLFYRLRTLGRAESRMTGSVDGSAGPQALIDGNRELGRAEARWIPEDLGGGVVDRQAIRTGKTRGEACSRIQFKRDC